MKKHFLLFKVLSSAGLYVLILSSFSCNKFIELEPISSGTVSNYFSDKKTILSGVNGLYNALQSNGQYGDNALIRVMEMRGRENVEDGDPGAAAGTNYRINVFQEQAGNTVLQNIWTDTYNGIMRCNTLIEKVKALQTNGDADYNHAIGQAYFLRALQYFNLVRLWGKVPLPLSIQDGQAEAQRKAKRAEISRIYEQMITDLQQAVSLLPKTWTSEAKGRATQWAAQTLLGKIYVYQKKWQAAKNTLQPVYDEIMNSSGNITTVPSSTTFPNGIRSSKDIIFAVYFRAEQVSRNARYRNITRSTIIKFKESDFESNDNRKDLYLKQQNNMPLKFNNTTQVSGNNIAGDFPILRAAEALLLYAEACNEIAYSNNCTNSSAWKALNKVRTNAGLTTKSKDNCANQTAFRKEVYQQRRLELGLELDRWFDVVRTGQLDTMVLNINSPYYQVPLYRKLYPVPQTQIDNVSDKSDWQNPGY